MWPCGRAYEQQPPPQQAPPDGAGAGAPPAAPTEANTLNKRTEVS